MALITAEEVAVALGIDVADELAMSEVRVALEFVEEMVAQYCSTSFDYLEDTAVVYSGSGKTHLSLGRYLQSLTSVFVLNADGTESYELLDVVPMPKPMNVGFRWLERRDFSSSSWEGDNVFPTGLDNIKVTGTWGFDTTTSVPAGIKFAIVLSVKHFFDLRDYSDLRTDESGFGRSASFASGRAVHYLPAVARKVLDRWKNSLWSSL